MKNRDLRLKNLIIGTIEKNSSTTTPSTPSYTTPSSPAYYLPKNDVISPTKRWLWFLGKCGLKSSEISGLSCHQLSDPSFLAEKLLPRLPAEIFDDPFFLRSYLSDSLLKRALGQIHFFAPLLEKKKAQVNFSVIKETTPQLNQIPALISKGSNSSLAIAWNSGWDYQPKEKLSPVSKILICLKKSKDNNLSPEITTPLEIECSTTPYEMLWSPAESYLTLKTAENRIEIWEKETNKFLSPAIVAPGKIEKIIWAPCEKFLAIKSYANNSTTYLTLWKINTLPTSQQLSFVTQWEIDIDDESITTIQFSPDETRVAWSTQHGHTTIFNLTKNMVEKELDHPSCQHGSCSWNSSGTKLATFSEIENLANIYIIKANIYRIKDWKLLNTESDIKVKNPTQWIPKKIFKKNK